MNDEELGNAIKQKYGQCFWNEFYDTMSDLEYELEHDLSNCEIAWKREEFGVTLVEIADNNMWCCIVVVRS